MADLFKQEDVLVDDGTTKRCWICEQRFNIENLTATIGYRDYNGVLLPTYPKLCALCLEEFESGRNPIYKPKTIKSND